MSRNAGRFAVLCPGPSLALTFLRHLPEVVASYGVFVGVNRAVEAFPCDWWVFNDVQAFGFIRPQRRPNIFTLAPTRRCIENDERHRVAAVGFQWFDDRECNSDCPTDLHWRQYSMTMALVLCEKFNAGHIDIFGCDWSGSHDWDGPDQSPISGGRSDYRWQNEMHHFSVLEGWLRKRGVSVQRVLIDESL